MYGTKWHFSHLNRTECLFCTVENGIWGFLTVVGRIFPFFGKDDKDRSSQGPGPRACRLVSRQEPASARQSAAAQHRNRTAVRNARQAAAARQSEAHSTAAAQQAAAACGAGLTGAPQRRKLQGIFQKTEKKRAASRRRKPRKRTCFAR